ncbi:hypothetical protein ACOSQ3_001784 [Xanthoceras sorbifolium]
MHLMKKKKLDSSSFDALKLDMAKAYDHVEWVFLELIMDCLGFSRKWIDLILQCVTIVTYSFLVNGEVVGNLTLTRGLRRGNLLTSYLFIICSEGFSSLIEDAEIQGQISGLRCGRYGPRISHLFFAVDRLFFFRATYNDCSSVRAILDKYVEASSQMKNRLCV